MITLATPALPGCHRLCLTPTRNESWIIAPFLAAARMWASRVIVADQGSTDGTREFLEQVPGGDFAPPRAGIARLLVVVCALGALVPGLEVLGFRLAMAAFCIVLLLALGCRSPLQFASATAAGSLGAHALFADALGVALPAGRLGF